MNSKGVLLIIISIVIAFAYSILSWSYADAEFSLNNYKVEHHYVSMEDGIELAVTVLIPKGLTKPSPVIFQFVPYKRITVDPKTGNISIVNNMEELISMFLDNGYVYVLGDMRGSGISYGNRLVMNPSIGQDGKEIIDWIAKQKWCNGNIGMVGGSYHGWSQYATAGHKPKALKCIMPEIMGIDLYTDLFYPGGIESKECMDLVGSMLISFDNNSYVPESKLWPTLPVVDEDGDGELVDEIPVDVDGSGTFLDDGYPPKYSDGNKREKNIYYNATANHGANINMGRFAGKVVYRDDVLAGKTLAQRMPNNWPVKLKESGIPIYIVGGWFDLFTRGVLQWYSTLAPTNEVKILVHPSYHNLLDTEAEAGPYWTFFGIDLGENKNRMHKERLRFFDYYLKGIDTGIENDSPVRIYVMNGEGWREEKEWPLERQVMTDCFFGGNNTLSVSGVESEGKDSYKVDFTHAARYGTNKGSRWVPGVEPDSIIKRTEQDKKCLTYTSEPVEEDTEITGHPIVTLWVSSTADYGDFFVYLEDVDENGEVYYVTEGMLRAGFAGLKPNEDILAVGGGIDVLPDLPWHGYKKGDYIDGIFKDGKIVKLVIDLEPTSWVIKKGHKIRVSIACSDWPTFRLHPKLSPNNDPGDKNNIVPVVTIYRDKEHPSGIKLPVIKEED